MPTATWTRPRREKKRSAPITIQTTLFDLATAIDTVCERDDDQTPTAMMQHIINSRRVVFTNVRTNQRVICNEVKRTDSG